MKSRQNSQTLNNFAKNLSDILKDPSFKGIIRKNPIDSTIEILDQTLLVEDILPYYFNHNRFDSFRRQMHLYGFKKIRNSKNHIFSHDKIQNGAKIQELTIIMKQQRSKNNITMKNQKQSKENQNKIKLHKEQNYNSQTKKQEQGELQVQNRFISSIDDKKQISQQKSNQNQPNRENPFQNMQSLWHPNMNQESNNFPYFQTHPFFNFYL